MKPQFLSKMTVILVGLVFIGEVVPLIAGDRDVFNRDNSEYKFYGSDLPFELSAPNPEWPSGLILFNPYISYPTGSWPEVVATGDMNNDGLNDVVLGTSYGFDPENDYKIFVFLQNQQADLESPVKYVGGDIEAIDLGYLNDDNLLDVAIGYGDSVGIFYQNGAGGLDPMVSIYSGDNIRGIAIGELNNDGLMDIASLHWNDESIRVFLQESPGVFGSGIPYIVNRGTMQEIDIGDVTGDNLDDVVFDAGENLVVLAQDSTGELTSPVFYRIPDIMANGIALGDVNSDGRKDVVVSYGGNTPTANIAVFLQDRSGSLQEPPVSYECYDIPEPVEIADLDMDGRNDVVTANGGWMAVSVYHQDSGAALERFRTFPIPYASHYNPQGLALGDINNDNKPDIALADYNNGLVVLINSSYLSVDEFDPSSPSIPRELALRQNYPNPFNPTTTISFDIPDRAGERLPVEVIIYDMRGRHVRSLVSSELEPGRHRIVWNGENDRGEKVSSGVYFYILRSGDIKYTRKMTVVQ
jgi:hypothetical protein